MTRDQYLTEAMGECWHIPGEYIFVCHKCGLETRPNVYTLHDDFSTPNGFFKLFEWAQQQEWWFDFLSEWYTRVEFYGEINWIIDVVNPDRFADAIEAYLKGRRDDNE